MSSSVVIPDRVLIVDKRLVRADDMPLQFIQLLHPRTKQEQSYAVDPQSQTVFELSQCSRSHASWFINDQHVVPDGALYIVTPVHMIFLLLPSLWSRARNDFLPVSTLTDGTVKALQLSDDVILEKITAVCDTDDDRSRVKLNEAKLMQWLRERVDRLKKQLTDEEHAFDLICEYLPDEIAEHCQKEFNLHGNVRYETPVGQKPAATIKTTTTVIKKTVEVTTTKAKRVKK